jgi:glutamyl-tRNA synthetase
VFGPDKLDWFNSQYLRSAPLEALRELALKELQSAGIPAKQAGDSGEGSFDAALELLRARLRKPADFSTVFRAFFSDDFDYNPDACRKFLKDPKLKILIPALGDRYLSDTAFTLQSTEEALRQLADREGVKAGLLINAVRVALTGQGVAPGLFEIMLVLGRERTLDRLRRLSAYLEQQAED